MDWSGGKLGDWRRGVQPGRRQDHQGPHGKQRDLIKMPLRIPCALSELAVRGPAVRRHRVLEDMSMRV